MCHAVRYSFVWYERVTNSIYKHVTNSYICMYHPLSSNSQEGASTYVCVNESPDAHNINASRTHESPDGESVCEWVMYSVYKHVTNSYTWNTSYPLVQLARGRVDLCVCEWVMNCTYKSVTNSYIWTRHILSCNLRRAASTYAWMSHELHIKTRHTLFHMKHVMPSGATRKRVRQPMCV